MVAALTSHKLWVQKRRVVPGEILLSEKLVKCNTEEHLNQINYSVQ